METKAILQGKKLVILRDYDNAYAALRAMDNNDIGCVLVADSTSPSAGIVTDRDLALCLGKETCDLGSPLSEVWSSPVVAVSEKATIDEVIAKMIEHGVRRIPVIDSDTHAMKVHAIITVDDLILNKLISIRQLADIFAAQNLGPKRRTRNIDHQAHATRKLQNYQTFMHGLARSIDLSKETTERLGIELLRLLCMRITSQEAKHLLAQLPAYLKEALEDATCGPKTSIDEHTMITTVQSVTSSDTTPEQAADIIGGFWLFLGSKVSVEELADVLDQLPQKMRDLLLGQSAIGSPAQAKKGA